MAKKFFYVCAGLFLLALSYHLGARSATAQAGGTAVGVAAYSANGGPPEYVVATSGGDVYAKLTGGNWRYLGNALGAGPTSAQSSTWGQVKSTYRK